MIEPITAKLLEAFRAAASPGLSDMSPVEARAMYREMVAELDRPAEPLAEISAVEIDARTHSIPARLYVPDHGSEGPLIVYFHGGGWVIGDLDTHHAFCTSLARQTGIRLLAIDYRLAPEAVFPAAHDDCLLAATWALQSPGALGSPVEGIALAGDSAGANLAAFVASRLRSQSGGDVLAQLLLYPVTDLVGRAPSYQLFGEGYLLDRADLEWFFDHYLPGGDRRDSRVSILHEDDLSPLPPTVLMTCGLDPLRDEGRAFAARLVSAGVPTVFREARGHVHGIASMRGAIPSADQLLRDCVADFHRLLARERRDAGARERGC